MNQSIGVGKSIENTVIFVTVEEAIAQVAQKYRLSPKASLAITNLIAEEREACAQLAEHFYKGNSTCQEIADEIRKRGEPHEQGRVDRQVSTPGFRDDS